MVSATETAVVAALAQLIGLVPVAWLAWRATGGRAVEPAAWWIALGFAVSWIADEAAHHARPELVGVIYQPIQAAIIGGVFLDRREARWYATALAGLGIVGAALWGGAGVDTFTESIADLSIVGIVSGVRPLWRHDPLRMALLVAFGGSWLAWLAVASYPALPRWPSYLAYQGARLVGALLFCRAALRPAARPALAWRAA